MKRHALVGLAVLAACRAPEDALVSRCTTGMMSLSTRCELSAVRFTQPRSSYIDGNTKKFKVRVSATFSVPKGRVAVSIPGCAEGGNAQVAPGSPASFQCDAAINRSTFRFEVRATPVDGGAEGFAGSLDFKPI